MLTGRRVADRTALQVLRDHPFTRLNRRLGPLQPAHQHPTELLPTRRVALQVMDGSPLEGRAADLR